MSDEYVPTTEAGKEAIANGADPDVVRDMEADGELRPGSEEGSPEHIDNGEGGDKGTKKPEEGAGDGTAKPTDKAPNAEDDEAPGVNREVKTIPAWKAHEMVKKAKEDAERETRAALESEFEAKIKAAGDKPGGATDDDVQKIADEFGLKPEVIPAFIERIGGVVSKHIKVETLSEQDRRAIDSIAEAQKKQAESEGFNKEFTDVATQEALRLASGGKQVTADVIEKVKGLAFSSTYHTYRLADIIRLEASNLFPRESKSAESGKGGLSRGTPSKSIDEMSPDEILNMPDDEFDALSTALSGGQSRFTKSTVPRAPKR